MIDFLFHNFFRNCFYFVCLIMIGCKMFENLSCSLLFLFFFCSSVSYVQKLALMSLTSQAFAYVVSLMLSVSIAERKKRNKVAVRNEVTSNVDKLFFSAVLLAYVLAPVITKYLNFSFLFPPFSITSDDNN